MARPFAWSYSALTSFETCPRRHYETRVAKTVRETEGAPLLLGNAAHKVLELRAKNGVPIPKIVQVTAADGTTISQTSKGWEEMIQQILSRVNDSTEVVTERQICLDDRFCETDWFSKTAWVRGVVDLGLIENSKALLLDYKTGKRKPDSDQLKLFSALAMHVWPKLERVVTGFLWLKTGEIDKETYTRADIPDIWNDFLPRVRRIKQAFEKDNWPERPSGLCKNWCPCHTCPHNGVYKNAARRIANGF